MVKYFFIIFLGLHGFIHLMGFVKAIKPDTMDQLKLPVSKPAGIIWLVTCFLILFSLTLLLLNNGNWWYISALSIVFSQVLIIKSWSDAKFGTIANVLFLVFIVLWHMGKV